VLEIATESGGSVSDCFLFLGSGDAVLGDLRMAGADGVLMGVLMSVLMGVLMSV